MKPAGVAILTALLFVGMCSTMQMNQLKHQDTGYVPQGDRPSQSEEFLNPNEK